MFWKKHKRWKPELVYRIDRWMTDPHSSDDKVAEGLQLAIDVLRTTFDMAAARRRYVNDFIAMHHDPARERPGG